MQNVPLMPKKMEKMSIQDFKVQEELEIDSKVEFNQEHKFLGALVRRGGQNGIDKNDWTDS